MAKKSKKSSLSLPLVVSLFIILVLVLSIAYAVTSLRSESSVTESDAYGNNLSIDGGNLRVTTPVSVAKGKPFEMTAQFRVPKSEVDPSSITNWYRQTWNVDICGTKSEEIRENTDNINFTLKGVMPKTNNCLITVSVSGQQSESDDYLFPGYIRLNIENKPNSLVISGPTSAKIDTRPEFTSSWTGSNYVKSTWTWGARKCSPSSTGSTQTQTRFTPIITKMPSGGNCPITLQRQLVTGDPSAAAYTLEFATASKTIKVVN